MTDLKYRKRGTHPGPYSESQWPGAHGNASEDKKGKKPGGKQKNLDLYIFIFGETWYNVFE